MRTARKTEPIRVEVAHEGMAGGEAEGGSEATARGHDVCRAGSSPANMITEAMGDGHQLGRCRGETGYMY